MVQFLGTTLQLNCVSISVDFCTCDQMKIENFFAELVEGGGDIGVDGGGSVEVLVCIESLFCKQSQQQQL